MRTSTAAPTSISNLSRPWHGTASCPDRETTRTTALDADSESLCFLECRTAFEGFLTRSLLAGPLRKCTPD